MPSTIDTTFDLCCYTLNRAMIRAAVPLIIGLVIVYCCCSIRGQDRIDQVGGWWKAVESASDSFIHYKLP